MKPVLAWVKKHLVIVICAVIAVILLPTSIVMSSGWTAKVRQEAQKKASDELNTVANNKVTYTLPAVLPGVEGVSLSTEPNVKLTEHFKAQKERWTSEATAIGTRAEQFNKRTPLIEGLFPRPKSIEDGQSKGLEFADIVVGGRGRPGVYQRLFDEIRAGGPPTADIVGQLVKDAREREVEKIKAGRQDRQLTAEENIEITKRLVDLRQSEYRKRSSQLSVYGGPEALMPRDDFPAQVPAQPPSPAQAFRWQWDYWIVQDLLMAIDRANGPGRLGVDGSVVKRIEMISVGDNLSRTMKGAGSEGNAPGERPDRAAPSGDANATKALVAANFNTSVTGRWNGTGNQIYSVRNPQLVLVVSSARLPELFDALAHQNFMTVNNISSITAVDPWKDLEEGYYYGEEPVVRVSIMVETVWLRSWMAPLMPDQTRRLLNVAYTEPKTEAKPGEGRPGERGEGRADERPEERPEGREMTPEQRQDARSAAERGEAPPTEGGASPGRRPGPD